MQQQLLTGSINDEKFTSKLNLLLSEGWQINPHSLRMEVITYKEGFNTVNTSVFAMILEKKRGDWCSSL